MSKEPIFSHVAVYHYQLCCDDWETLVDNVLDVAHHIAYMLEEEEVTWEIGLLVEQPSSFDPVFIRPHAAFKHVTNSVMGTIFQHLQAYTEQNGWEGLKAAIELRFLEENFMPGLKAFRQLQDKYVPIAGSKKIMADRMENEDLLLLEQIHTIGNEYRNQMK